MILPALKRGGYGFEKQVETGTRLGGGRHLIDAVASKAGDRVLVSLKWQQTAGTAEQKVPFEIMCLADVVRSGVAQRAYLVLGGDGWKLRDYYTSGALSEHLIHSSLVRVVTLEAFIRLANNGNSRGASDKKRPQRARIPKNGTMIDVIGPVSTDCVASTVRCCSTSRSATSSARRSGSQSIAARACS
jgi:hypothetical protein